MLNLAILIEVWFICEPIPLKIFHTIGDEIFGKANYRARPISPRGILPYNFNSEYNKTSSIN